jgi:hypothetical protein
MPSNWEFTRETNANLNDTMEYFMHAEDLPKLDPENFKQITIKNRDDNTVTFEMQGVMMGRKMNSVVKQTLDRSARTVLCETLDGDAKGSNVTMSFRELPKGTEIKYTAALELGALGFLAKGASKSAFERVVDGAVKHLNGES